MSKSRKAALPVRTLHSNSFTYESPPQKPKTKKIKSKQLKESEQLFDSIARNLVQDKNVRLKHDLEIFCRSFISQLFGEFKHELASIEVSSSTRFGQIESRIGTISARIESLQVDVNSKIDALTSQSATNFELNKVSLETERTKRLALTKKIQQKDEKTLEEFRSAIQTVNDDSRKAKSELTAVMSAQSRDVHNLKEKLDEM